MPVTDAGFALVTDLLKGSGTEPTYIAYGSDDTDFNETDTALGSETDRASATVTRTALNVSNDTIQFYVLFTASGSVTIKEVGVFNDATTGTCLIRKVLDTQHNLTSGQTYSCTINLALTRS